MWEIYVPFITVAAGNNTTPNEAMAAMGGGHGPSLSWALAVVGDGGHGGSEGRETEADPLEVQTSEPGNGAGMVFSEHAAVAELAEGAILGGGPAENCRQSSDRYVILFCTDYAR